MTHFGRKQSDIHTATNKLKKEMKDVGSLTGPSLYYENH